MPEGLLVAYFLRYSPIHIGGLPEQGFVGLLCSLPESRIVFGIGKHVCGNGCYNKCEGILTPVALAWQYEIFTLAHNAELGIIRWSIVFCVLVCQEAFNADDALVDTIIQIGKILCNFLTASAGAHAFGKCGTEIGYIGLVLGRSNP